MTSPLFFMMPAGTYEENGLALALALGSTAVTLSGSVVGTGVGESVGLGPKVATISFVAEAAAADVMELVCAVEAQLASRSTSTIAVKIETNLGMHNLICRINIHTCIMIAIMIQDIPS